MDRQAAATRRTSRRQRCRQHLQQVLWFRWTPSAFSMTSRRSQPSPMPNRRARAPRVTRIVFTPDDLRARAWLKQLATEAGLVVREDAVGNTFFRWVGTEPDLPAVATALHIDAIPHAGMYDGTVGVHGGLAAIRALQQALARPRRSIELVLLTSEEPTRFGIGCIGSRLLGGAIDPEKAGHALHGAQRGAGRRDAGGGTCSGRLHRARWAVKLPKGHSTPTVELQIEQGSAAGARRASRWASSPPSPRLRATASRLKGWAAMPGRC